MIICIDTKAKEQGIDIERLSNDAIAKAIDFDELPYSKTSYTEAIAILKKHKLDFHYPLARSIAESIDKSCKQILEEF